MKKKKQTKLFEWQTRCKSGNEKCAKCPETRHLTVDHIVPCHILEQFMLDKIYILYEMEENFEIVCRYCNQMKGGRIDPRNPKTYEILDRVLVEARDYYLLSPQLWKSKEETESKSP